MGLPMFVSPPLSKRQLPSKQSDSADSDTSRTRGDSEDRHRRRSFPYNIVQQHIHRLQQLQYLHRTRDMSSFNQNARRSLQSAHLLGQSRVHMVPGVYNPNITAGNGLHYGFIPQRLRIERRQRSGDGSNRIRDDGMMMDESDGNGINLSSSSTTTTTAAAAAAATATTASSSSPSSTTTITTSPSSSSTSSTSPSSLSSLLLSSSLSSSLSSPLPSSSTGNPSINTQASPGATIQPSEPSSTTVPSTPTIPSSPSPSDDVIRRVTLIRQNQRLRPRFRLLSPVSMSSRNTTANGNTSNGSHLPSNQSSSLTSPSSPHTTNGRNESFITRQLALTPLSISLTPAILSSHIANGNVNEIDRRQYGDGVGWGESSGYYGHSNNTTGTTTGQNQTSSSPSLSSLAPLSPTLLSLNQAFPLSTPHSHAHSQNFTSHGHTIPLAPHTLHSFSTSADSHRILSPIPRRYTTYPDALAAAVSTDDFDVPEDTAFLFDDGTSAELVTVANNEIEEFGSARSSASGECC